MAKARLKIRPHPDSLLITRALERVADRATAIKGVAYRACEVQYANRDDLITGAGSRRYGGRWNPRGKFHAVYLSFDIQVALADGRNLRSQVSQILINAFAPAACERVTTAIRTSCCCSCIRKQHF